MRPAVAVRPVRRNATLPRAGEGPLKGRISRPPLPARLERCRSKDSPSRDSAVTRRAPTPTATTSTITVVPLHRFSHSNSSNNSSSQSFRRCSYRLPFSRASRVRVRPVTKSEPILPAARFTGSGLPPAATARRQGAMQAAMTIRPTVMATCCRSGSERPSRRFRRLPGRIKPPSAGI